MSRSCQTNRAPRYAALLAVASVLTSQPAAFAGTCSPVRVASRLPGRWRTVLEALARATQQEGLPWSCPGGSVELVLDGEGGAELTVIDDQGRSVSRHVGGPDEVVPTGEALLASPVQEAPPPAPVAPPPPSVEVLAAPSEPRALVQLVAGPRVTGPGAMAWLSTRLGLQLPFGPWFAGFWARYDAHLAGPTGTWVNFSTTSISASLSAGRRLLTEPFELRVSFDPSVAAVVMEAGNDNLPHPDGAKLALRLGTSVAAIFPIKGPFRCVISLDGEFAPAGIHGLGNIDTQDKPPQTPAVPTYSAGILLGVEASVR
jgi:hypothetical protein